MQIGSFLEASGDFFFCFLTVSAMSRLHSSQGN